MLAALPVLLLTMMGRVVKADLIERRGLGG